MKKFTGLTNREIGHFFGNLSYSGVSKVNRRFEKKIQEDSSLKRKIMAIMGRLYNDFMLMNSPRGEQAHSFLMAKEKNQCIMVV